MTAVDVFDLVSEDVRKFVFRLHQPQQTRADENMPAGQGKGEEEDEYTEANQGN